MDFLEKDLEDVIFEAYNEDRNILNERGLDLYGKMKRQLNIGGYGIADLVNFDLMTSEDDERYLRVTVTELKKDKVNVDTFLQAVRYVKGISQYISYRKPNLRIGFRINLIGRSLDLESSLCYLIDLLPDTQEGHGHIEQFNIYTYKYNAIKGVIFKETGDYKLTHEGFKCKRINPF